jgi:hypothetical protein
VPLKQLTRAPDIFGQISDVVVGEDNAFAARTVNAGVDAIHFVVKISVPSIDWNVAAQLTPGVVVLCEDLRRGAIDNQDFAAFTRKFAEVFRQIINLAVQRVCPTDRQDVRATKGAGINVAHAALWRRVR